MPSAEIFVRFLPPIFPLFFISLFVFIFSFKSFRAVRPYTPDAYVLKYVRLLYLGASWTEACYCYLPSIKLLTYAFFPYVPFLRHYMHRYDLSFGQAGLPGSCAYALRSR